MWITEVSGGTGKLYDKRKLGKRWVYDSGGQFYHADYSNSYYRAYVSFFLPVYHSFSESGSLCDEGNAEAEAAAARELDKLLKESVLPIKGLEKQINVSAVSVGVSLQANLALPAPGLQLISQKEWDITAEKKALIRDAAAFIRAARRISDFIE